MKSHLLVVGGGPAGCAAAIHARINGLSVTLIDQPKRPRHLPGETVAAGIEPLLRQLGVWDAISECNFLRHSGIWRVDLNGRKHFAPYGSDENGEWLGLQLDRSQFHQVLRRRAQELGVVWHQSKALRLNGDYRLGWTIDSDHGHSFHAAILMDATGKRAWMAKNMGLVSESSSPSSRVLYGWKSREANDPDTNPIFKQLHEGWDWEAPISNNRTAWVRMRSGEQAKGMDATPRIYQQCAGINWFLIGDAACLTTPASGNGVLRALMSGIFAAHLSTAMMSGQVTVHEGVNAYQNWVRAFWESSVQQTDFSNHFNNMGSDAIQGSRRHSTLSSQTVTERRIGTAEQ